MRYHQETWEHAHHHAEHEFKDGEPHLQYHRQNPGKAQTHHHILTVTEAGVRISGHHTDIAAGHHLRHGGRPVIGVTTSENEFTQRLEVRRNWRARESVDVELNTECWEEKKL